MEKLFDIAPYSSDYPNFMEALKARDEVDILEKQGIGVFISRPVKHVLYELERRYKDPFLFVANVFYYGYILGKRAKRAKRG